METSFGPWRWITTTQRPANLLPTRVGRVGFQIQDLRFILPARVGDLRFQAFSAAFGGASLPRRVCFLGQHLRLAVGLLNEPCRVLTQGAGAGDKELTTFLAE